MTLLCGLTASDVRGYSIKALFELLEEAMELKKAEAKLNAAGGGLKGLI